MENFFCNGNCASCQFLEKAASHDRVIRTAVIGLRPGIQDGAVIYKGCCIQFTALSEISSIIDFKPDVVLDLVDSMNLAGTMYPVTKCIDMGVRMAMVLENYDSLRATGHSVDCQKLSQMLDMPVAPAEYLVPDSRQTIAELVLGAYDNASGRRVDVAYGNDIEESISIICDTIGNHDYGISPRYVALRLLEHQDYILPYVNALPNSAEVLAAEISTHDRLEKGYGEQSEELIRKARLGFINGALQETLIHGGDSSDHTLAQKLDSVLTNKWLGLPLLVLVLFLVFEATFTLGAYPQEWIGIGVDAFGRWLEGVMAPGWFSSMIVDGVVQGVGAVLAFLPNIIILFFFLSLLEDSGYMARAAFVMDKIMHRIGLHGKSFIPMLIGFGCNVPAIMAARNISDSKDRTLTMLMIPFMSCSARLPVYLLFVSAFFAKYKALMMISIYASGIVLSILFAFVMKRTKYFRRRQDDYVSELPAFRKPTWRNTGMHIWERVSDYLQKISTVILAASVVIWALEYFPADRTNCGENKEQSYLCDIGRWMSPVMEPLGFDWKMNVCILTGLPAKEAIVSTMGILYHASDEDGSLVEVMRNETYTEGPRAGEKVFTPGVSIGFMMFVLLYFPCIATVATLKREIGGRWAAFSIVHSLILAWVVAFIVHLVL